MGFFAKLNFFSDFNKIKNIGVTGASGQVGTTLCKLLLKKGYAVRALYKHHSGIPPQLQDLPVEHYNGDIRDESFVRNALEGVDAVIHTAAIISIDGDESGLVMDVNYGGTKNMYMCAKAAGAKKIIHISSIHAIDYDEHTIVVNENTPLATNHFICYNRSKAMAQAYLESMHDPSVVVVNLTGVIGPGDYNQSKIGTLLFSIAQGKLPFVLDVGFDWVDVRDVAQAIYAILTLGKARRYILSGHYASIKQLSQYVGESLGKKTVRAALPVWCAKIAVPFDKMVSCIMRKPAYFTKESIFHMDHSNKKISHAWSKKELGYKPRPLAETVRDTIRWFQRHYSKKSLPI